MGANSSTNRVLIAGLDSAGKTTILFKLHRGEKRAEEHVSTIPTMDFNVMKWTHRGKKFAVWDVGGQDAIRPLWRHHLTGTQALVYVVDSNDIDRVQKAAEELHKIMLDSAMQKACLLVFANKADLPNALPVDRITQELQLEQLGARAWHVEPCVATRGEGLWTGLQWLAAHIKPI